MIYTFHMLECPGSKISKATNLEYETWSQTPSGGLKDVLYSKMEPYLLDVGLMVAVFLGH